MVFMINYIYNNYPDPFIICIFKIFVILSKFLINFKAYKRRTFNVYIHINEYNLIN